MQTATAKAWLPNQPRYALPDLHAPAKPQEGRAVRPGNGMVPRLFANAQKPAIDGDIGAGRDPSIG
jgi:hypothetical protein